jgi:hypothetical protein
MVPRGCRRAWRIGGEGQQEADHAIDEFRSAVSGNIGPSLRFIAVEDMPLGPRQSISRAQHHIKSRSVFTRHHQHAVGEFGKRGGVEIRRNAQYDTGEAIGIGRRKWGDVARNHGRNMHSVEPEMVEHGDQTGSRREIVTHSNSP